MEEKRIEKFTKIITIVIIILLMIGLLVFKIIPELKNAIGSSDSYIDYNNYETVLGIRTNTNTSLLLIINNDKITNIVFLDQTSLYLYNKDIEKQDITQALTKIIDIMSTKNLLPDNIIYLIKYFDSPYYSSVKDFLSTNNLSVVELEETYQETASMYDLEVYTDNISELKALEKYSRNLIRNYQKNQIIQEAGTKLTKQESIEASKEIYEKLTIYAINVENQEIGNPNLPIENIPGNSSLTIYPSTDSWYYIKDHQVYAYIVFKTLTEKYDFCYNGSIDNMKEGECS